MAKKILIIEDDALIAKVYGSKYLAAGFETAVAADGQEGLDLLKTFKPDLVHLDLGVPKVNGAEIVKHMRKHPDLASLPIVVLSNTYQNRLVKAALEAGATECVSKATCTPKMMLEIVEKILSRGRATAPEAASPAAPAPSSETTEHERHAAFQAQTQDEFLKSAPRKLALLQALAKPLVPVEGEPSQVEQVSELTRAVDSFAGRAGMAGFEELSQMSCALAALLREILDNPKELTVSAVSTILAAVDFLTGLFERATLAPRESTAPPVVLVVDDDAISRKAVRLALARLNMATLGVEDPAMALHLMGENRFGLIVLDVEMPGMDGFELCKALRASTLNHATPVVFVTRQSGLESRERSVLCGGNDMIAKPFVPMELAVKVLGLLL